MRKNKEQDVPTKIALTVHWICALLRFNASSPMQCCRTSPLLLHYLSLGSIIVLYCLASALMSPVTLSLPPPTTVI
ncbi:hypothetical protein DFH08DRAFT_969330 [Mycena albidolilacea]|uniref:Uncharacterized protein n=1 Tax=Mycena albidolilacea TaxID=1033008 RepID=A0AAD7EI78_9AGAR|nr:hypothetical protein DFH08DRAFT_969330 [Mycena albidolilacea]